MFARCEVTNTVLLPALRIAVSKALNTRHEMTQEEIAAALGISQASVNKYLNGRYSERIGRIEKEIESKKITDSIVESIISDRGQKRKNGRAGKELEKLSEGDKLFKMMVRVEEGLTP